MRLKYREDNGPYNIFAEAEVTVEFYDCDPMQVVFHANYLHYFETGRRTLMEKIGYTYIDMEKSGYTFPVIDISAKYLGSLRFKDRALIKTVLLEYENRLRMRFEIRNIQTSQITTWGLSTQMAFDIGRGESCFVCPTVFTEKVEALIKGHTS